MKRWLKRTLIGLFGATVLLGSLGACTHRLHHHGWSAMSDEDLARAKARLVERAGARLDLDEAQQQRLDTLADELLRQRRALRGDTEPRAQLRALIAGPAFDRGQAEALLMAKTDAVRQQGPAVIQALADFYDGLNPAQQQQLRDLLARGHHGHRR
jgi:protein CpxP